MDTEHPRKVLVIDDDTLTRMTLCKIFRKLGFSTVEACNGLAGIKMFQQEHPDFVVTDILMPDKEGLQTIMEIRQKSATVPIFAMSGGGSTGNMQFLELAKSAGANKTFSKPFKPVDIQNMLEAMSS